MPPIPRETPDFLRAMPVPYVVLKARADGAGEAPGLAIVYLNDAAASLVGCRGEGLAGPTLPDALPLLGGELADVLAQTVCTGAEQYFSCRNAAGDRYFSVRAYRPCAGYCACVLQEVTDHVLLERRLADERRQLERQAMRDPLTGLYHVRQGRSLVERALAEPRWDGQLGALFMFDVDDFKKVNDEHGHHRGDDVLRGFARLLERSFRRGDIVFRAGGDEFSAFVADMPSTCVAERICTEVVAGVERLSAQGIAVSVSVGAAVGGPGRTYEAYYRAADQALYSIKRAGKSAYRVSSMDRGLGPAAFPLRTAARQEPASGAPVRPPHPQPVA